MDEIRALYGPANDDIDPPVLKRFSPADGAEITENTPTITVYAEDAGYDPVAHPGTTLIDPDKIRFYLDGSLVRILCIHRKENSLHAECSTRRWRSSGKSYRPRSVGQPNDQGMELHRKYGLSQGGVRYAGNNLCWRQLHAGYRRCEDIPNPRGYIDFHSIPPKWRIWSSYQGTS